MIVKDKIILYWHLKNCCPISRFLRSVSYRGFTRMVYRFLGNKRIPLPACAYTAIRKTFPISEKEEFTGYVDESDWEIQISPLACFQIVWWGTVNKLISDHQVFRNSLGLMAMLIILCSLHIKFCVSPLLRISLQSWTESVWRWSLTKAYTPYLLCWVFEKRVGTKL